MAASTEPARRGTVAKALQTLGLLVDGRSEGLGVREIASAMGLAPSSAHRLLAMLRSEGMVVRNPDGSYSLGLVYMRMAWKATARFPLTVVARPLLERLVEEIDETALLAVYDPSRRARMFVLAVESTHPLRYVVAINEWTPMHPGASGLAISAFLPPEEQRELLGPRLERLTSNTLVGQREMERKFARVRARGYAVSRGQRVPGAVGVAAPIFGADGRVVGTVALSIPEPRFQTSDEARLGEAVRRAAVEITTRIGGHVPD